MKRITWVDIAKYICIMVVMFEHLESKTDILSCFLVPFCLQLFFFTAGYTHRKGQSFKPFIIKKARTLLIPWFVFGIFDILVSQVLSFQDHDLLFEVKWNFMQVRGFHDKLWFVAAIFVAYVPFYFFVEWFERENAKLKKNRSALFIFISFLLFSLALAYTQIMDPSLLPWNTTELPWHLDYAFVGMFFMFLGYVFRREHEKKFDKLNTGAFRLLLVLIHAAMVYAPYFIAIAPAPFYVMAKLLVPLSGLYMAVAFSKIIPPLRYLTYVGENTLIYFGLHGKVLGLIQGLLRRFAGSFYASILANTAASSLFSIGFTFLISFILLVPAYIINRWFPFVMGRGYSKR